MMKNKKITVLGGDMRLFETAGYFFEKGYETSLFGIDLNVGKCDFIQNTLKEALSGAFLVVLPLPYSRDNNYLNSPLSTRNILLDDIWENTDENAVIAAGMADSIPDRFRVFDYSKNEEFAIRNAAASVEGALSLAIRETDITLLSSKVLVIGYGRLGKLLAHHLYALGAKVKVFARKSLDRAIAESNGFDSSDYDTLKSELSSADIVFNTVPAGILDSEKLEGANQNMTVIDLASSPGGVDRRSADYFGIRVISAPGLPGKYSPKSAGVVIARCIENELLNEK